MLKNCRYNKHHKPFIYRQQLTVPYNSLKWPEMLLGELKCSLFVLQVLIQCSMSIWSATHVLRGVTALIRAVSGEKQIYSGNLEILPGIGKHGKFFGKYKIFSGHWAKIWYYMLSNNIYTVICTLCMRFFFCILTLENSLTPHDMKRPISNVSY